MWRAAFQNSRAGCGICATYGRPAAVFKNDPVGLSSKLFPLSADDTFHALANAAFLRMLRQEAGAAIPGFARQHVRQASVAVEVVGGEPSSVVHFSFGILDFDADGFPNVERFTSQ